MITWCRTWVDGNFSADGPSLNFIHWCNPDSWHRRILIKGNGQRFIFMFKILTEKLCLCDFVNLLVSLKIIKYCKYCIKSYNIKEVKHRYLFTEENVRVPQSDKTASDSSFIVGLCRCCRNTPSWSSTSSWCTAWSPCWSWPGTSAHSPQLTVAWCCAGVATAHHPGAVQAAGVQPGVPAGAGQAPALSFHHYPHSPPGGPSGSACSGAATKKLCGLIYFTNFILTRHLGDLLAPLIQVPLLTNFEG